MSPFFIIFVIMGFESFRKSVRGLIKDLENTDLIVNRILSRPDIQEFIINFNQLQLGQQGINSLGVTLESIGGGYSTFTIGEKQAKGQRTDIVTLLDTGEFYESMRVELSPDYFQIEADTMKDGVNLEDRWSADILGLTDKNLQTLIDVLRNEITEVIRQKIHARFAAA